MVVVVVVAVAVGIENPFGAEEGRGTIVVVVGRR